MLSAIWKRIRKGTEGRVKLLLLITLISNLVYAIFLFVISKAYSSKWFFSMSVYYLLLSAVRSFIFFQLNPKKELRKKIMALRICACFLFLINIAVSCMMFALIYTTRVVRHHEITVITIAVYTFSAITVAIVCGVKGLKKNDHVYFSAKIVALISASVSMVTLTNTMLATFGEDDVRLRKIILPILSGVVALFIIACAVFMIIKSNKSLRMLKDEKGQG